MRVLIFGDSITQGFWDVNGGWVAILRKEYDQQKIDGVNDDPATLFNLGISADSSDDVVARFKAETDARNNSDELAFVISIGVNDSRTKAGKDFSDTERYLSNLNKIHEMAKEYSDKILFVGLTPCVEERSNPVSWGDTGYTNERLKSFDDTLQKFCEDNELPFVEVLEPFKEALKESELLPDALHPNEDGHKLISDLVKPKLGELIDEAI